MMLGQLPSQVLHTPNSAKPTPGVWGHAPNKTVNLVKQLIQWYSSFAEKKHKKKALVAIACLSARDSHIRFAKRDQVSASFREKRRIQVGS
jgi:hypothetical protein